MKKINNGFMDYYYLNEDGTIYNASTNNVIKPNKEFIYRIKTDDNSLRSISLRQLYKLVYDK